MKTELTKLEISTRTLETTRTIRTANPSNRQRGVNPRQTQVQSGEPKGTRNSSNLPNLNDETYCQVNSVSFQDDFQVLIKHYRF